MQKYSCDYEKNPYIASVIQQPQLYMCLWVQFSVFIHPNTELSKEKLKYHVNVLCRIPHHLHKPTPGKRQTLTFRILSLTAMWLSSTGKTSPASCNCSSSAIPSATKGNSKTSHVNGNPLICCLEKYMLLKAGKLVSFTSQSLENEYSFF